MAPSVDDVLRTHAHRRVSRVAAVVRIVAGVLFVYFGIPKFTDHAGWVSGFGGFGLPESSLLVYGTGLVEIVGGVLLVLGVALPAVSAVLAAVMVGAVVFGGIVGGSSASFVFGLPLLVAAVFVLWSTLRARQPARVPQR